MKTLQDRRADPKMNISYSCYSFRYNSDHELPSFRIILSVLLGITSVPAVSLNSLILYSIWKNPSLHKPSYLLLANLALADLQLGAIGDPAIIIAHVAYVANWSTPYCLIKATAHLTGYWLGFVSLYSLTLMSIDRLLAVKLKNRYRSFVTYRRIWMVTVPPWIGTLLLFLAFLLLNGFRQYVTNVIIPCFAFAFLSTITLCYSMAFYSLKKLTSSVSSSSQQPPDNGTNTFDVSQYRRSMNTMILVMLTTILLCLPSFCSSVAYSIVDGKRLPTILAYKILRASDIFLALNSLVNPLLYLWCMQDIRQAAKNTVKKILRREHHSVQVVQP